MNICDDCGKVYDPYAVASSVVSGESVDNEHCLECREKVVKPEYKEGNVFVKWTMEDTFDELLTRHDVKGFVRQYHVFSAGKLFRIDFAFPERLLAVECDGLNHKTPRQKKKDKTKDAYLCHKGWRVMRIPYEDICKKPDQVIVDLKKVLSSLAYVCYTGHAVYTQK